MECPHCHYVHGFDSKTLTSIEGNYGEFYKLSNDVVIQRQDYYNVEEKNVYACPKCKILFIDL